MQELELRLHEEEVAERMNIEHKKAVIIDAFNRQEEQLDDSKLVSLCLNFFRGILIYMFVYSIKLSLIHAYILLTCIKLSFIL